MKIIEKYFLPIGFSAAIFLFFFGGCIQKKNTPAIDPSYVAALRLECDNLAAENDELRSILTDLVKGRPPPVKR